MVFFVSSRVRNEHQPGNRVCRTVIPVLGHPLPLVPAALFADTPAHTRRDGAVLEVVAAGSHQGSLKLTR
jgi:hypothetical protein